MEIQSNTPTVFKLLAVLVNIVVVTIILIFRNKNQDRCTQQTSQQQEPPE